MRTTRGRHLTTGMIARRLKISISAVHRLRDRRGIGRQDPSGLRMWRFTEAEFTDMATPRTPGRVPQAA